ncbi:DivIVA domain-containing protein [Nocardioides sp. BE266]|uniref:DivIVA domain-containing protein n=1 Tax=Nocardioides sp. BE266 TaxID=2817725 RepID=UPI0028632483|nr:DivIVA domain-containing protein [Nocardioides sp. BE266]MDR7252654.1 DivIVA domain-containing protein [Nocardioides sp. BE266]
MMWLFAVLVVLVMGGVAMVASGRGGAMAPAYDDRPDLALPDDRPLEAGDLRSVRFPLALRGYRMSDVDALLARLATELEDARRTDDPEVAPDPTPDPEGSGPQPGASGDAGPS